MKNTQLSKNRYYKPMKIGESLQGINQKFLYKFGELDYTIHAKWAEIVGSFFIQHSEPQKISSLSKSKDDLGNVVYEKFLHVNVIPSAAIEFQHFQNKIIEKINSFFGYKAIKGIIIHQKIIKTSIIINKKKNEDIADINQKIQEIKKSTVKISDKNLEQSIVNLGLSITNNN